MTQLTSDAERNAEKAEKFTAFSGFKLEHVKKQLEKLLALIGRGDIFDEYTQHDISHINKMLGTLDWLIPEDTKKIMSPADWLLTVLAIYFHDLGMLVTKKEYEERASSGFQEFKDKVLFAGNNGKDYRIKVEKLGEEKGDRFAYQEFVRNKHAERIRAWITGQERENLGITTDVVAELDNLLSPLSEQFRRDLSLVCESHHLNDLDNFRKYKVSQPYGDSDDETANVQYSAILMRTADLLHITSDRTPSIYYRVINPTDPISQDEWAKQMAVTRVRSKTGLDKEGNPEDKAPRDTIEVHAFFKKVDGFFGLTSYLAYGSAQLQKSYEWAVEANKTQGAKHKFPWRYIDDSHIETEGFIKDTFEFTFDQAKILDLLTGHTLYNDINIVLREMVQNSIDAVRLQRLIDAKDSKPESEGKVLIHWNSVDRILSVQDDGTGMTQQIIERNLLKVGASRYQGEEFKTEYPTFSPISRFGIGILSTFMIADSVEILTCHPEEESARQLSLRSVHGKYLIRLLDKYTDAEVKQIMPHGTQIKLKIRHSIDLTDIVTTAKQWIVIPNCNVTLVIDDKDPLPIGFRTPKEAIRFLLLEQGYSLKEIDGETPEIRIIEDQEDNVSLAYAVKWSKFFKQWEFLNIYSAIRSQLGTCVEGIRVEFNSPGFSGYSMVALANTTGINAPKTDVARSGLEMTPERDKMLDSIYKIYCKHIKNELEELHKNREFSLSWAVKESKYLVNAFKSSYTGRGLVSTSLFEKNLKDLPLMLVEQNGQRSSISAHELLQFKTFCTIDCASVRSAEDLLREIPGNASYSSLLHIFNSEDTSIPNEPIVFGDPNNSIENLVFSKKEVKKIKINRDQRRIDLYWTDISMPPLWRSMPKNIDHNNIPRVREQYGGAQSLDIYLDVQVAQDEISLEGITNEIGVRAFKRLYLFPNTEVAKLMLTWLDKLENSSGNTTDFNSTLLIFHFIDLILSKKLALPVNEVALRKISALVEDRIDESFITPELVNILNNSEWSIFDTSDWLRSRSYF